MRRYHDDPDVELMIRAGTDEVGAYQALVDRYWSRIFGRFFRQFGDRQEAEDLAQDVFLRLYRSRKRYRPRAKFSTWLFHIARNVARNALRRRRRRPLQPIGDLIHSDVAVECLLTGQSDTPSQPLERAELSHVVRRAMAELLDRQRMALELQMDADQTYAEIAHELDMSPKAAKSLLYRARTHLRDILSHRLDSFGSL